MGQPVYVVVDLELCHPHLWPGTRDGGAPIRDVLASQPMAGVPFALLVVIGVAAAGLTMTALPRTLAVARGRSS